MIAGFGRLGLHVIETRPGVWYFVGSVPAPLAYMRADGSAASPEELENARHAGPRFAGLRSRVFATRAEAIDTARAQVLGVRPYVLAGDAVPLHEVTRMASNLRQTTRMRTDAWLLRCAEESGVECACASDESRRHDDPACPLAGLPRKPFVHKSDCHIPHGSADCSCKP